MTCPHLTGRQILMCTANGGVYVPSIYELEEYCLSSVAKTCPYPSLMLFGIRRIAQSRPSNEEPQAAKEIARFGVLEPEK